MSQICENTLVTKTNKLAKVQNKLNCTGNVFNVKVVYKDGKYALLTFDSNGEIDGYPDCKINNDDYLVKEYVNPDWDWDESRPCTDVAGRELPVTISYLIETKFLFDELSFEERARILKNIEYSWGPGGNAICIN